MGFISVIAQKETNIWYFGRNVGLDFNSGVPVSIPNNQFHTVEGCSSIADGNGNLLFYTEGDTVWNRNHQVMQNGLGLKGHYSSSQSALIVPKPGSSTIYYVFTVDAEGWSDGLNYSELDMTLDGGMGAIVPGNKNIQLLAPTSEKLTARKHANRVDFWVVVHDFTTDAFYSYLVTSSGVNPVPVISNIGSIITSSADTRGCMKISPDGNYLVLANVGLNEVQLFNFDISSGVVSNLIETFVYSMFETPYGVEFSPSSQLLYVSDGYSFGSHVVQYDLNAASIFLSAVVLDTFMVQAGTLQLGPDRKIYSSNWDGSAMDSISVINNPDIVGIGCNFVFNSIYLPSGGPGLGLPNFVTSFFSAPYVSYTDTCSGLSTFFTINNANYDSLLWNFGDPISGSLDTSSILNPSHVYANSGQYTVTFIGYDFFGNSDTLTQIVNIIQGPIINLGNDTTLCLGQLLNLDATNTTATYLWQDNSINPTFIATQPGQYWVEVSLINGCVNNDTINVIYDSIPIINLGNDTTTICDDTTLTLNALSPSSTYLWQDGSTDSVLLASLPNTYWVQVTNNCGTSSDTIEVFTIDCDTLTNDTTILTMPNVFTPNGDGNNDIFIPSKLNKVVTAQISIYNRWGQQLFYSELLMQGWDGRTTAGIEVPSGTYFWIVNYVDIDKNEETLKGHVSLLRN